MGSGKDMILPKSEKINEDMRGVWVTFLVTFPIRIFRPPCH